MEYRYLFDRMISLLLDKYTELELLDHTVVPYLIL